MMLEIKKYPEPILKKECQEVKEITPEIKKLIENMSETMERNDGVGLAGPQVGILKRIIVVGTEKGALGFINPKIIKKSKEILTEEEGCLSFPGLFLKIKRAKEVEIEALVKEGEKIHLRIKGLLARVFQHEIDHLDGILFIDHINFWQRWKIREKLKALEKSYGSH